MRISVQWLTGNDNKPKGLWPIEWLAITYSILTTLAMFVLWPDMDTLGTCWPTVCTSFSVQSYCGESISFGRADL